MRQVVVVLVTLLCAGGSSSLRAQSDRPSVERAPSHSDFAGADAGVATVLGLLDLGDSDNALSEAERLLREYPGHPGLNAAYLMARWEYLEDAWVYQLGYERFRLAAGVTPDEEIRTLAARNIEQWPDDALTQVAFGYVRRAEHRREALAAAATARELAPADPMISPYIAHILYRHGQPASAIAFADTLIAQGNATPALHRVRVKALLAGSTEDKKLAADGIRRLVRQFPEYAPAHTLAADLIRSEAMPHVRAVDGSSWRPEYLAHRQRATELAPASLDLRTEYWESLAWYPDRAYNTPPAALEQLVADVSSFASGFAQDARTRFSLMHRLRERLWDYQEVSAALAPELRRVATLLVERHAGTPEAARAELELIKLIQAELDSQPWTLQSPPTMRTTAESEQEVRTRLRGLLDAPHSPRNVRVEAGERLFNLLASDPRASADDLISLHEQVSRYEYYMFRSHWDLPLALIERGRYAEAETRTRAAFDRVGQALEKELTALSVDVFATFDADTRSDLHRILGLTLLRQGRLAEAEAEIDHAIEASLGNVAAMLLAGELSEARGDTTTAAAWYVRGSRAPTKGLMSRYWESAVEGSESALRRLYQASSMAAAEQDIEAFIAAVEAADRERRRQRVVTRRLTDAAVLPTFELERMDGGTFSSEQLIGKIVVINFWGVWCGPCRAEAPFLEQFHAKYRDDPDVVFLTVANDPDPAVTRRWIAEQGHTFPVLLDADFNARIGIQGYPTTLFVDRVGSIVYSTNSTIHEHLVDEFSWRVEALLSGIPNPVSRH
jgi:thiol-disulfide isomerase/thioredoxin